MAGILDTLPTNYNILSPTAFKFESARLPNVTYFCQNANIPDLTLGNITLPNMLRDYAIPGNQLELGAFEMGFIVDEDLANYLEIHDWMRALANSEELGAHRKIASDDAPTGGIVADGVLSLLTNTMNINKEIYFQDMFPTTLGEVAFTSATDDIEAIICTASFMFSNFTIKNVN
jgi:hypothetical protein